MTQFGTHGCAEKYSSIDQGYLAGCVFTDLGIVMVYSEKERSNLVFIFAGRLYDRHIDRGYTKRGLATVAGRFAREIAQKVRGPI